jgi:hypothetical protein
MPNVYLSLDSHGGVLTDPVDVIPSIIRHVFAQPGNVSTIFDNVDDSPMFSVRELEANHGTDPALFVAEFQKKLVGNHPSVLPDSVHFTDDHLRNGI